MSLEQYVAAKHVVVSPFTGHHLVEDVMSEMGIKPIVALRVPHFTSLLAVVATTNHVSSSQAKDDWRRCPSPESPEFQVSAPISNPLQTFLYKLLLTTDWLSLQANLTESFLRSIVRSTLSYKLGTSNERSHIDYLTDFVRSGLEDLSGLAAPEISDAKHGRWISALIHGTTVCHPVHWAIALSSLPQARDPIENEHPGHASLSFYPIPDLFPVPQSALIVQKVDITATLLNGSNIKTAARNQRVPKAHLMEVIKHDQPLSDIWNAAKRERKRAEYRQEVLSLLLNEECTSLLDLFQRAPIKLRWLCRYDRNWVEKMLRKPPIHLQIDLF
ncbi:hypothetical protein [Herbaspirillum rubrisubalbicans]|uniref:hypothetical protein n=2 Tax=Herbaspirillum rubrisubalbicans TaxID=80842 RepID=UPI0012E87CE8|nr:hypothetical protein [Herbaspirillum rubrisubalbicans]